MIRSTMSRIGRTAALTGLAAAAVLGSATAAQAGTSNTVVLAPGQGACVQQYANCQVRGEGTASGQGAKFKLTRNGTVINNTPGRANNWAVELRSSSGNFPGPGNYAACATNTGTTNTTVYLQILTDSEF